MQFPYPCARCGYCCLMEVCPEGMRHYRIAKSARCPALAFDPSGLMATCSLYSERKVAGKYLGIGSGCCLKARCYKNGTCYEWAPLPADVKRRVSGSLT